MWGNKKSHTPPPKPAPASWEGTTTIYKETPRDGRPFSESHILPPTGPRQGGWDEPYRDLSFGLSFRSGAEIALTLRNWRQRLLPYRRPRIPSAGW
jgi:hypothetical protein